MRSQLSMSGGTLCLVLNMQIILVDRVVGAMVLGCRRSGLAIEFLLHRRRESGKQYQLLLCFSITLGNTGRDCQ